jgi:hypothetical protein
MYLFACEPAKDSIRRFLEFDDLVSPLQDSRAGLLVEMRRTAQSLRLGFWGLGCAVAPQRIQIKCTQPLCTKMDLRNVYLSKQCVHMMESRRFCDGEPARPQNTATINAL